MRKQAKCRPASRVKMRGDIGRGERGRGGGRKWEWGVRQRGKVS
jgi:hypothetical protein